MLNKTRPEIVPDEGNDRYNVAEVGIRQTEQETDSDIAVQMVLVDYLQGYTNQDTSKSNIYILYFKQYQYKRVRHRVRYW